MALNKALLKGKIEGILLDMMQRENTSVAEFATRLSDAVDDYVKEGELNYTSGLVAPNGPVTGVIVGNIQ
tara:strand:- start:143 stop:352 length:210 start_codon:yes stop_codon:yes gene_type:complete